MTLQQPEGTGLQRLHTELTQSLAKIQEEQRRVREFVEADGREWRREAGRLRSDLDMLRPQICRIQSTDSPKAGGNGRGSHDEIEKLKAELDVRWGKLNQ